MKPSIYHIAGAVVCVALLSGCGGEKTEKPSGTSPKDDPKETVDKAAPTAPAKKGPALLVAGNEFGLNDKGSYTIPNNAALFILRLDGDTFAVEKLEEKESNIFHKAIAHEDGILTIGANKAMLKHWTKKAGKWEAKTLWNPTFGGKQNRLRDFEMADFNGDGKKDLAIATHDQGVVAVVWNRGDKWEAEELDRKAETFVHEIEVGDLNKDGKLEIYATPSEPNTVSSEGQGGKVIRYAWNGSGFDKSDVVSLESRHIKEILVKDVDGDGTDELYATLEAETKGLEILKPVEIRRYDADGDSFKDTLVTSIDDRYCRFLVSGDLDGDGKEELVASAFSSGVWLIRKTDDGYEKKCIDAKSGGFEHAAFITDLDGDGKQELYIADDMGGRIKTYTYDAGEFEPKVIYRRPKPSQAMVWNMTAAEI